MGKDMVNHPPHYEGKVECIDALESATAGLEGIEAVDTANAIKYLWRWKKKNGKALGRKYTLPYFSLRDSSVQKGHIQVKQYLQYSFSKIRPCYQL